MNQSAWLTSNTQEHEEICFESLHEALVHHDAKVHMLPNGGYPPQLGAEALGVGSTPISGS